MSRINYALPEDVLRKADPSLSTDAFGQSFVSRERTMARIEAAERRFESETGRKFRATRSGTAGEPETYETHEVSVPFQHGVEPDSGTVTIDLDQTNVLPIDPDAGDEVQIRFRRDEEYHDITDEEGVRWELPNLRDGVLKLHLRPIRDDASRDGILVHPVGDDVFVRLTYRYGNLGGSSGDAGETTLAASITDTETGTVAVDDAARLNTGVMTLGTDEYVYVADVDPEADEITLEDRGLRGTDATAHDAGTALRYVPADVREAVAAKAAAEIVRNDDQLDFTVEGSEPLDIMAKSRELEDEWAETIENYTRSVSVA